MDLKQIKIVINLIKCSDLAEFEVEEKGFKLKIKRGAETARSLSTYPVEPSGGLATRPDTPRTLASPLSPITLAESNSNSGEAGFAYVKSPMVGTFYRSPSPESPSFVDVNSKVDDKVVVCIIEAMKIMNEIQAETKGTVVEVLVENGQPVEYGQRLFKVKTA